jgi:hypothetical protein
MATFACVARFRMVLPSKLESGAQCEWRRVTFGVLLIIVPTGVGTNRSD